MSHHPCKRTMLGALVGSRWAVWFKLDLLFWAHQIEEMSKGLRIKRCQAILSHPHTHTPRKTIITIWLPLKSDDAFLEQKSPFCLQGLHFLGEICHPNVLVFRNAAVKLTVEVREVGVDFWFVETNDMRRMCESMLRSSFAIHGYFSSASHSELLEGFAHKNLKTLRFVFPTNPFFST